MNAEPGTTRAPTTVSLDDEEAVKCIVTDALFGLWATVSNLTRLRRSKRERYRVREPRGHADSTLRGRRRAGGGCDPGASFTLVDCAGQIGHEQGPNFSIGRVR